MAKKIEEVEKLKRDWESDPCWDIYDTEGFEAHTDELRKFQQEMEEQWRAECEKKHYEIDEKNMYKTALEETDKLVEQYKTLYQEYKEAFKEASERISSLQEQLDAAENKVAELQNEIDDLEDQLFHIPYTD